MIPLSEFKLTTDMKRRAQSQGLVHSHDDFFCSNKEPKKPSKLGFVTKSACDEMNECDYALGIDVEISMEPPLFLLDELYASSRSDFTPLVRQQIAAYSNSRLAQLYVSQEITIEGDTSTVGAEEGIQRFLQDPGWRFLTLLGDFGTGKTALTRKLAHDLGLRYLEVPLKAPIPLRIDLKDVGKALGLEDLLVNYLARTGLTLSFQTCLLLLEEGRLVLLFDGFDEMATSASVAVTRQNLRELTRTARGMSKTIVTSRTVDSPVPAPRRRPPPRESPMLLTQAIGVHA